MACLVVSSTGIRAQVLAGLLAQCCSVVIAEACDSAAAALIAIDRFRPSLVILDRDGDSDDCERIARHLLQVSTGAHLILLSLDPRLDPLRTALAPRVARPESWQALLSCVLASEEASCRPAELVDPLPDGAQFEGLRPRERSVLELIGSGLGSRDIARVLGVSQHTVETYRKSLSAKLGVSGARLVRVAVLYSSIHSSCIHRGQFAPCSAMAAGGGSS